jgi:hypothetical protein
MLCEQNFRFTLSCRQRRCGVEWWGQFFEQVSCVRVKFGEKYFYVLKFSFRFIKKFNSIFQLSKVLIFNHSISLDHATVQSRRENYLEIVDMRAKFYNEMS